MRSSLAATLLASLALAAACSTREPETTPFRIQATRASGASLLVEFPTGRVFQGTGRVLDPGRLVVEGTVLAEGLPPEDVTLSFDRSAAGGAAFSAARLDGRVIIVSMVADPALTGPAGEPLPVSELVVATAAEPLRVNELVLAERVFPDETLTQPLPANVSPAEDVPFFTAESNWAEFEPGECGPVYYDVVFVTGDDEEFPLRRGEQREVTVFPRVINGPQDRPPWRVLHVLSWHRERACAGEAVAWTQVAAWR